jgi:hypothetical protein
MPGAKMSTRAIRAAKAREPQVVEGDKRLLALKGPSTSALAVEALTDLVRQAGGRAGGCGGRAAAPWAPAFSKGE